MSSRHLTYEDALRALCALARLIADHGIKDTSTLDGLVAEAVEWAACVGVGDALARRIADIRASHRAPVTRIGSTIHHFVCMALEDSGAKLLEHRAPSSLGAALLRAERGGI